MSQEQALNSIYRVKTELAQYIANGKYERLDNGHHLYDTVVAAEKACYKAGINATHHYTKHRERLPVGVHVPWVHLIWASRGNHGPRKVGSPKECAAELGRAIDGWLLNGPPPDGKAS